MVLFCVSLLKSQSLNYSNNKIIKLFLNEIFAQLRLVIYTEFMSPVRAVTLNALLSEIR